MVAIFTGGSVGLERSSVTKLGALGVMGDAVQGRSGDSVFVNGATGDLVIEKQDEFLVGLGPDVSIVRTYNSLGDATDDNGDNWRQSTDRHLTYDLATDVFTRVSGDGTKITYAWDPARLAYVAKDGAGAHSLIDQYSVAGGSSVSLEVTETGAVETRQFASGTEWSDPAQGLWDSEVAPAFDTIVKVSASVWKWTDGNTGSVETYNASGQLQSIADRDGRLLSYTYTGTQLTSITNSNGEWVKYTWNGNNLASVQTFATSTTATTRVFYTYDTSNRLSTVTVDLAPGTTTTPGTTATPGSSVYTTTYTYDGTSKRVASITQSDGSSLTIVYDDLCSGVHDGVMRVKTLTQTVASGVTRATSFVYANRTGGGIVTTVTDPSQQGTLLATTLESDANGNLVKITMPPASATASAQTTSFTYNADGTLWKVTDALGKVTAYTDYKNIATPPEYIANGLPTTITDKLGNQTTRVYGSIRKSDAAVFAYSAATPSSNFVDASLYVRNLLLSETTTASDDTVAYGASASHTTSYVYDAEGHLRFKLLAPEDVTVAGVVHKQSEVTEYRYNAAGILASEVGYPEWRYDFGTTVSGAPTEAQVTAQLGAIPDRNWIEIAAYGYDARGGLLSATKYGGADATTGAAATTNGYSQEKYVYDQAGRLLSAIDGTQNITSYVYDGMGRMIGTMGADLGVTTVSFQDKSSTTVVTLASGLVQTSLYNLAGDLIAQSDSQANLSSDLSSSSQWTSSGATRTTSTAVAGNAAYLYTVLAAGTSGTAVSAAQAVNANDTVVFEITLKAATGPNTNDRIGISGTTSSWGANGDSIATILSGPGTLVQAAGGLFDVSGLSTTTETRVRIVRRFAAAESAKAIVYVGNSGAGAVAGNTVILSAPIVQRSPGNLYDKLGRLRVTFDQRGYASYAVYDNAGRKTGDVAADGALVEYRYNADNQLIATIRYATRVTAANLISLLNPDTALGIADIRPVAAVGDEWAWRIYDNGGRVIETIAGDGAVTRLDYDESGNLVRQTEYFDRLSATTLADPANGLQAGTPRATMLLPTSAYSDWTYAGAYNQTRSFYDKQGRLIGSMDRYGGLAAIVYDESGRKIDEIHYEKQAASSFTNAAGAAVVRTSASFADLRANVVGQAGSERHIRYIYDGQVLRYVVDALGSVTQYDYDRSGEGTTTTRYANTLPGTTTDFTFDNVKALLVTLASSGNDRQTFAVVNLKGQVAYTIDGEGGVTGFAYDGAGNTIRSTRYSKTRPTTALPSAATMDAWIATTPSGATTTIALAPDIRVTRSFYDARGRLVYAVDGEGNVRETSYDEDGRVTAVTSYDNSVPLTDASQMADVTAAIAIDKASLAYSRTQRSYDQLGRLSNVTDALGVVTHYDYFATGEIWKQTAAYGTADAVVTSYTYDLAGRVGSKTEAAGTSIAAITSYTYDGLGNVVSATDPSLNVTYNYYDLMGRVTSNRDAEDYVTKTSYNSFGEVASVTRYAARTISTDKTSAPAVTTSSSDATTYSYFDLMGRVLWTRDAENYVTGTTYTCFGAVWTVTRYANTVTTAATLVPNPTLSANSDAKTTFEYDRLGRLKKTTDAEGKYESQTYTAFGGIDTKTNKLGGTTSYLYDHRGLMTSETMSMTSVDRTGTQQSSSVVNTYTYDGFGNRKTMVEAFSLTEVRSTSYGYDRNNRLSSVSGTAVPVLYPNASGVLTEGTGTTTTITRYDSLGNVTETLVQTTIGTSTTTLSRTLAWYDRLGRKSDEFKAGSTIDKGTLTHWSYYASGNVQAASVYGVEVTIAATAARPAAAPAGGSILRTTNYSYDKLDRLTETKVAGVLVGSYSGTAFSYNLSADITTTNLYDSAGNLVRQTDGRGDNTYFYYDKLNRKTEQVDRENYLTTWKLDEDGNTVDEVRYANGVVGAVTTAAAPQVNAPGVTPTSTVYLFTDAANDRATHFTYDRMGRRLTEVRNGVQATTINATSGVRTTATATSVITYTYNELGEVKSKREATGDKTVYDYDNMGRMTKETDLPAGSYNETTGAIIDLTNAPVTQFWYDGLGNLTRSDENGRATQYQYYASGKLKSLTNADNVVRTYYYDGAGNKVAEKYLRKAGDTTYDAMTYAYDAASRLTTQGYATVTGATWAKATNSDTTQMAYNAYGEVVGRGMNLTSAQITAGAYQDQFSYDNAGHMWRTTAGDGTVDLYVYDENGNQTLDITSSGKDKLTTADITTTDALLNNYVWAQDPLNPIAGKTQLDLTAAINLLTNNGANTVGAVVVQGMIVTHSLYDGRNQLTQTRMPLRDRTSLGTYSTSPYKNLKSYNAFGEVASETDARGNTSNYSYNTLGKVIKRELPAVNWTSENGTVASARPTENYFYDASGRVVGVQDANGNLNTRTLLAGTGYGKDDEALVLKEYHADGGMLERQYDLHHDLKVTINEVGKTESYLYDALGQLIEQDHQIRAAGSPGNDLTGAVAVQLKDFYDYDNLGHRILHTNSQLGGTVTETTAYDVQGRVTSQIDLGGDTTSYSYTWDGTLVTSGLGTFGGWSKVTTNSSLKTRTDKTDYFGHTIDMIDYGGHNYDYTFDLSGRLVGRVNTALGETVTWTYFNTGMMQSQVSSYGTTYYGSTITATYQYDADNHRTFEGYEGTTTSTNFWTGVTTTNAAIRHQHAYVTWDAAGRMTSLADNGHSDTGVNGYGPTQIDWEYDLGGDIRHMVASYRTINDQGAVSATATTQDYWYRYDAMNRFVTTRGILVVTDSSGYVQTNASGQNLVGDLARGNANATIRSNYRMPIPTGAVGTGNGFGQGHEIEWDKAGNRSKDTSYSYSIQTERYTGQGIALPDYYSNGVNAEIYTYSDDGYLSSVNINGGVRTRFMRDAMGRVTDYREYNVNGYVTTNPSTNAVYQRTATYSNKGLVTSDVVTSLQGTDTFVNSTTYYYNADTTGKGVTTGGTYMGGAVTLSSTAVTKNGTSQTGSASTNTLVWWGGAMQSLTNYDSGSTHNTSTFNYDQSGHLQSVYIQDGRSRTVNFVTDVNGQILARQESDNTTTQGDPKEIHYYFNGMGVGDISNNGTSDVDYATSIAQHTAASAGNGAFRNGATTGTSYADFDQSYDPINGLSYASTSSRYVVQGGDTLTSIAQAVWGDASFWYMIADANGLDGTETLVGGQSLILPNKVHNSHNNTSTYRVYDPNEAIGDTAPTAVAPPKHGGCGGFGQILVLLVAVVVAIYAGPEIISAVQGALGGLTAGGAVIAGSAGAIGGGIIGGAVTGALASVVSQGFGLAIGAQDSFSWKGVALGAIGGAVGGGLGASGLFSSVSKAGVTTFGSLGIKSAIIDAALKGAVSSAISQGIGVATGLQDRFDWTGVAAAGIGAGFGEAVGGWLKIPPGQTGNFGQQLGRNVAGGIANAAARSVIDGTDFGDNIMAALPDVIANTIGNLAADGIASLDRNAHAASLLPDGATPEQRQHVKEMLKAGVSDADIRSLYAQGLGVGQGLQLANGRNVAPLGASEVYNELPAIFYDDKIHGFPILNGGFSEPFYGKGLERAPGIFVTSEIDKTGRKTFTIQGDVAIDIMNYTRKNVDAAYLAPYLKGVNMSVNGFDGNTYKINLNFHEASIYENFAPSNSPYMTRNELPYMKINVDNSIGGGALAYFDPQDRSLHVDPRNYTSFAHDVPHELLHWLGMSHSSFEASVMYPYSNSSGHLLPQEIKALVEAYKK
ncbi:DUF6531 domain-containing protein [Novosphingobium fuchskuhlense]|nr:LysM peptidoglycan-binding domain-containing protein [Novosphingobium fuchskuhlense]